MKSRGRKGSGGAGGGATAIKTNSPFRPLPLALTPVFTCVAPTEAHILHFGDY